MEVLLRLEEQFLGRTDNSMSISYDFAGTDVEIVRQFRTKSVGIINALADKMFYELNLLKEKAQARAPVGPDTEDHAGGTLRESFQEPTVEIRGNRVVGQLLWGGEPTTVTYKGGKAYDYARIIQEGSKAHAVNPLEEEGTRFKGAKTLTGHSYKRYGKGVLFFMVGGKEVFAEYAFPAGVTPNPFVEDTLLEMKDQMVADLDATVSGVMRK
jgi:hypothetical protein